MSELRLAVYAADPGLRRLGAAVRATVSFGLVVLVLLLAFGVTGIPWLLAVPGMLVASVASMTIGMGFRLRLRFLPLLLLAPSGVAGLALGVLVLGEPILTAVVFFVLGLVVVAATLLGRAGTLIALGGVAGFVAASIVRPGWGDLLWGSAAIVVGAGISAVVLGVALRERPRLETRRMVQSLRALAEQMPLAVAHGESAARRHLEAFGAAISATRARIAADPEGWPPALRLGDGSALADLEVRFELAVDDALAGRDTVGGAPAQLGALVLDPVLQAAERIAPVTPVARAATLDAPHAPVATDWRRVGRSLLSVGTQLLVAVVFALTVAQLLDARHWYWGVLAALVMVFGTTSATASISKGYRRVLGALAGLPVGLGLGLLVGDNLVLVAVIALVAMFFQQYVAEIAYGGGIFFLTVLITLLFGLTVDDSLATFGSRALLTGIGAVIGAGVGLAVLPARLGETLRRHSDEAIAQVGATLTAMAAGAADDVVTLAGRVANERFAALRSEAQSSRRGWPLSRHQRILAEQIGAGAVVARELRAAVHDYRSRVVDKPGFNAAVGTLAAKAATIRAQLTGIPSLRRADPLEVARTAPGFGLVRLERAIDGLAVTLRAG